ncbi:MAG: hypothetical protein ACRD13_03050 [Terriglobales bacterium]
MLTRFATFVGSLTCSHHWVRARWEDGSYGLRCQYCLKRHPQTWDQILAQPDNPQQQLARTAQPELNTGLAPAAMRPRHPVAAPDPSPRAA